MDAGYKDENGYVFVTARDDDVINVAGHRISTSSLEDAVLRHPGIFIYLKIIFHTFSQKNECF